MKPNLKNACLLLLACFVAGMTGACSRSQTSLPVTNWNPRAAAAYLDQREVWWASWAGSARDHGTFCVSCHTALPYALARPVLRQSLAESEPTPQELMLIDDVSKRVRLWKESAPYYSDKGDDYKSNESRGSESVLNAFILANRDARVGKLSADTRTALDHMWAEQQTAGDHKGAWDWLQFDQEPWEARGSVYYGACLAAMAAAAAPDNYASSPEIQNHLQLVREYLRREQASQPVINHVFLLWASSKLPGLLSPEQQRAIEDEAFSKQRSDGGWRLASMVWKWNGFHFKSLMNLWLREDGTPLDGKSDGVATGLFTLVLQDAGVSRDDGRIQRARAWLASHQNLPDGSWPAASVNKRHHVSSDTGRFMSDAATAFAVMALSEAQASTAADSLSSNRKP